MKIGIILAGLLNGNTRHCFLDRTKREDCLSANVTIVIGAAHIAQISPLFLNLIETIEPGKIGQVNLERHLHELWDDMEAAGQRWLFVPLVIAPQLNAFMFLFCGEDACRRVEDSLKAFGVPLEHLKEIQRKAVA